MSDTWSVHFSCGAGSFMVDSKMMIPLLENQKEYLFSDVHIRMADISVLCTFDVKISLESTYGVIHAYSASIPVNKLKLAYPYQEVQHKDKHLPKRYSVDYVHKKKKLHMKECMLDCDGPITVTMHYDAIRYGTSFEESVLMSIFHLGIILKEDGAFMQFVQHSCGDSYKLQVNGIYVGSPQEICMNKRYVWKTVKKKPKCNYTDQEIYEKRLIQMCRTTTDKIVISDPLPYQSDSAPYESDMCRLYQVIPNELGITLELFNMRYVPPVRYCIQLEYKDFEAAYQRTKTRNEISSSRGLKSPRASTPKKTFSVKMPKSPRNTESLNSKYLCLLDRQISEHISVFIDFNIFEKYIQVARIVFCIKNVEFQAIDY